MRRCREDFLAQKGRLKDSVGSIQGAVKAIGVAISTAKGLDPAARDEVEVAEWQAFHEAITAALAEAAEPIRKLLGA